MIKDISLNSPITPTIPNSPNVLNFPIILNSPITPNPPPTRKKTKKNMQNIRLFEIKALPLHRI